MKAAITTTNHYVTTQEGWEKTIPEGAIVIIREKLKPASYYQVSHEFCFLFRTWIQDLKPIDGEVQEVNWFEPCPKCQCKIAYVEVEKNPASELRQGATVHCAACTQKGEVEVYDAESCGCDWGMSDGQANQ